MMRETIAIGVFLALRSVIGGEHVEPAWPVLPVANVIDERIFARLHAENITPSPLSTDADFLRRVTLTTTGQLPTPEDVRSFLADDRPSKRASRIDALLAHPLHAAVWASRFSEMTGNDVASLEGPDQLKPKRAKMWHDWLRRRFEANTPYDELVRGILTATSREDGDAVDKWIDREAALTLAAREGFDSDYGERASLDLFWRRGGGGQTYPIEEMAERVASNFMGIRINCARCHKHPFDRWTQEDYRAFANVFAQVRFDMSPELRAAVAARLDERRTRQTAGEVVGSPLPRVSEVYLANTGRELVDEATRVPLPARVLGGPAAPSDLAATDRRTILMDWLSERDNPYFARNIVNRVWAMHFGRGMVEPLDGFAAANPPLHSELLDDLAVDFVAHGYDLRRLERLVLNSAAWQLSSTANDSNRTDRDHFARAYVRMPPPHALVDMWHAAVGVSADFGGDVPPGIRAVEIAPSRLANTSWDRLLTVFGRTARTQTCDCVPQPGPSIRQTLALMCDPALLDALPAGRVKSLCGSGVSDEGTVEELFLATISRFPDAEERAAALKHLATAADRTAACEDLIWSLINTQEFVTIH